MPITWNADMYQKLFLAIIKVHNISIDHAAVAAELSTDAQPCTAAALQKRLQRIKSTIKTESNGSALAPNAAKGNPLKRGKAVIDEVKTSSKKPKTGNSKHSKVSSAVNAVDESDEEIDDGQQYVKEEF
ncbi:Hypothetical protein R9X50_00372700 [Acrodontium crateriforme]|uniref:Uncharacterized protein n=1 Tax=Acrodontium crateriforme TaxID=150365 RepID=A0AAQ3M6A0_9PEZI|nr:Hypothetical protein R9X50_00372700 [Acrodontium crateriforme]